MTYNVFGGTLNLAQSKDQQWPVAPFYAIVYITTPVVDL